MNPIVEKRRTAVFSPEEAHIIKWFFIKTLIPMSVIIIISSTVLFFGLRLLMPSAGFDNYGLAPGRVLAEVSRFISIYLAISSINVGLMITLSTIVIYLILKNMVLPVLRITRELKVQVESGRRAHLIVRKTDIFLINLVGYINKIP